MTNIKGIIVFGSSAIDQMDSLSDIDVCVISIGPYDLQEVIDTVNSYFSVKINADIEITDYTELQLDLMLKKGSLFAHHLKKDGKFVYGEDYLNYKFNGLTPFESFIEELIYYNEIFQQLIDSRRRNIDFNEFDFSLVFTLVRNICIILSSFNGSSYFGRRNAYHFCLKKYQDFPVTENTYRFLESKKICYSRGIEISNICGVRSETITTSFIKLIEFAYKEFRSSPEIKGLQVKVRYFKSLSSFGFKERMSLEKNLYSILKTITNSRVKGFNNKALQELKQEYSVESDKLLVILKIFELRDFVKNIASGNAYVRDLALENVGTNRLKVFHFINLQLKGLEREINNLSLATNAPWRPQSAQ